MPNRQICLKPVPGLGVQIIPDPEIKPKTQVNALALINCSSSHAAWIEWAYQKVNAHALRSYGMTQSVVDYLMWHHFGRAPEERNQDLAAMYRANFSRNVNPANLAHFIDAYVRRGDLDIARDGATIRVPVLNVTGAMSPHIQDCGLVHEEQPGKISEAFRLFLQGEGYVAPLSPNKITEYRRLSDAGERRRACRLSPVIRITENPISEAVAC
ncbi:Protein NDRG3 [Operophtera brumata]|uniref:Protein NDRG3 n=1 Tax=Operophtera brumata TaxID=104452 RepID=A0A0L7KRK3_OPEBR|nr:Protein NDRG3 [Operophtera brumata]